MRPSVSVLVPTYGRTRVLGECIQSFLQQDYDGRAEMIVLNDHPEQHLTLDPVAFRDGRHVTIINAEARYADLGTKRNVLVSMASGQLVAFWDDDDIYLPSALSRMVERYEFRKPQKRRSGRESHCWQLQLPSGSDGVSGRVALGSGDLQLIVRATGPLWSSVTERSAVLDVSGFPPWDRRQDIDLNRKLIMAGWVAAECNTPGIPSCIHRLAGTPYGHAIDFTQWRGMEDNEASAAATAAAVTAMMDAGEEPRGDVGINPLWNLDYEALTQAAWYLNYPGRTVPRVGEPATEH